MLHDLDKPELKVSWTANYTS